MLRTYDRFKTHAGHRRCRVTLVDDGVGESKTLNINYGNRRPAAVPAGRVAYFTLFKYSLMQINRLLTLMVTRYTLIRVTEKFSRSHVPYENRFFFYSYSQMVSYGFTLSLSPDQRGPACAPFLRARRQRTDAAASRLYHFDISRPSKTDAIPTASVISKNLPRTRRRSVRDALFQSSRALLYARSPLVIRERDTCLLPAEIISSPTRVPFANI